MLSVIGRLVERYYVCASVLCYGEANEAEDRKHGEVAGVEDR